jgi:hypothetical protein
VRDTRDPLVGVGLLIGRGLTTWIRVARAGPAAFPCPRAVSSQRLTGLDALQVDLLQVWTQMALSVRSSEVTS